MSDLALIREIVTGLLLIAGVAFVIIGAVGMIRFPDFFTRMHAASLVDTLGAGLMLGGMMVASGFTLNTVKLLMILVFIMFTSPTGSYALANAALSRGRRPVLSYGQDVLDEEEAQSRPIGKTRREEAPK